MSTLKVTNIESPSGGGVNAKITDINGSQLSNRRININGAMQLAQRGTSFTGVNATAFHMDRYQLYYQNSSAAFTVTQSTDTPNGFGNSLKIDVTTADSSIASNEEIKLLHKIEGQDLQAAAKGTSVAKQLTLSFYVKATKTGTYIVELFDRDNSRDVSASYTVSDTNWNRYTLTFPADTTGAFDDDNASSLEISWWLVAGSAVQTDPLNTTWRSTQDAGSATGQVDFTDSTSNDWLITGIQLEVGDVATAFEHRSFGDELARCQRYYFRAVDGARDADHAIMSGGWYITTQFYGTMHFPVEMRTAPTLSYSANSNTSAFRAFGAGVSSSTDDLATQQAGTTTYSIYLYNLGAQTAGQGGWAELNNESGAFIAFAAEL